MPVDVLHADLDAPPKVIDKITESLSAEEIERASGFRFEKDRNVFTVTRAMLRILLAERLSCTPISIQFELSEHGKPSVAGSGLYFNVSHSGNSALFGFTEAGPIGVDVEWNKRTVEIEEVASRFFSAGEYRELCEYSQEERQEVFFRIWTRKEAFIKAVGEGLSYPLDEFEVSTGEEAALLSIKREKPRSWWISDCELPMDYSGAVAVNGGVSEMRFARTSALELIDADERLSP